VALENLVGKCLVEETHWEFRLQITYVLLLVCREINPICASIDAEEKGETKI